MKHTDYILLNLMKAHVVDMYQHIEENHELLDDLMVKKGYYSFLSVKSIDELEQWQKLIAALGLGFGNTGGVERDDNFLGQLDDFISEANSETKQEFLSWKNNLNPETWVDAYHRNYETVKKVLDEVKHGYDVHIVLFRCGDQWAAIDNDADRLFVIFGWQTGAVTDGEEPYSFMYVTEYGYKVLMNSGYSVKVIDLGIDAIVSASFTEGMTSGYQQLLDYLRKTVNELNSTCEFMKKKVETVGYNPQFKTFVNAAVNVFKDKIVATLADNRKVVIADGNSWKLDELTLPLVFTYAKSLGKA